jgi:predicted nucleotidyltransferase
MDSLAEIKAELSRHRAELSRRFHVREIAVFGSFARGDHRADSDVDILVDFDTPVGVEFIDLGDTLEQLLKRRVDLVSKRGINDRYFRRIAPHLNYVW